MSSHRGALLICIGLITFLTALMAELPKEKFDFSKTSFASNLYKVLKKEEGNIFFSPYSAQVVLAMTYMGADGLTAKEFQKILSFPEDKKVLEAAVRDLLSKTHESKDVILKSANAMFLQKEYSVKPDFLNSIVQSFKSDVKHLDFTQSAESAKEINNYVSKNTAEKIKELFTQDAFTLDTKMVLVNAIYFKGSWLHKFDTALTVKGDFHLDKNNTVKVDFMNIKEKFNYKYDEELDANVLEMKYSGDMAMILVVPKEIEGLKQVEGKIGSMDLMDLRKDLSSTEVQLTMPKFKLEHSLKLKEALAQMGLNELFEPGKANFKGISNSKDLYVSDAVQKAFIEVNEEGSEAAAATGVHFVMRMMPIPPIVVNIKAPFLFLIVKGNDTVFFMGRLSKP